MVLATYPCVSSCSLILVLSHAHLLRHCLVHFLVPHLVLHLHCFIPLPHHGARFFIWKFPFFIPVIGNKSYILFYQLVACWKPLARRVSFILDIHVVHPYLEACNILIVLHILGGYARCVLYVVLDHVQVDIEGHIVVLWSPLMHSMS
jgi:hypothetical protein